MRPFVRVYQPFLGSVWQLVSLVVQLFRPPGYVQYPLLSFLIQDFEALIFGCGHDYPILC